ncbi:hypothetical protein BBJ28_00026272 [Nothophytophthora sp. Chile5]|nr:hypothetical protein BBJ28_00026272 [Nothophytophthora sp. Chile5]
MARLRGGYTNGELNAAVQKIRSGEAGKLVSKKTKIPYRTLMKWVAEAKKGIIRSPGRRGPAPLLPSEAEENLCEWVIGRQLVGKPAKRQEVIDKACEISSLLFDKDVGDGWYKRFLERHPTLAPRVSQSISKARNAVDNTDVQRLFNTLLKLYIEKGFSRENIFNVDETAFQTTTKSKKVLAARGSPNVWHTDASAGFHLSIVACASASGLVVPPVFILPGKTVRLTVMDGCSISAAAVTTTESGFMNGELFLSWLAFFAAAVPASIKRPLLLIMDGCSSHYSLEVVDTATELGILLVCLPANSTHLFQPLDIAVFASFKGKLRRLVDTFTSDGGEYNIDKATAIKLAGLAWEGCNLGRNIVAGFRGCGIFPLSLVKMQNSLDQFERNGVPTSARRATWLQVKETVQQEVLALPPPRIKTRQRKTATVSGKLLTRTLLTEIAQRQPKKRKRATTKYTEDDGGALAPETREAIV